MSLSFVKSAVLSSTDGVSHNEEKEIENTEVDAVRKNAGRSKSLFEQLRENQDKEEEKHAEQQRAIMRGTGALDEEDAAHLNALTRSKLEKDLKRKTEVDQELALFRAAKEERREGKVVVDDDDDEESVVVKPQIAAAPPATVKPIAKQFLPKIVGKRKRKPAASAPASNNKKKMLGTLATKDKQGSLGGLLGGYGSSSDDD